MILGNPAAKSALWANMVGQLVALFASIVIQEHMEMLLDFPPVLRVTVAGSAAFRGSRSVNLAL